MRLCNKNNVQKPRYQATIQMRDFASDRDQPGAYAGISARNLEMTIRGRIPMIDLQPDTGRRQRAGCMGLATRRKGFEGESRPGAQEW